MFFCLQLCFSTQLISEYVGDLLMKWSSLLVIMWSYNVKCLVIFAFLYVLNISWLGFWWLQEDDDIINSDHWSWYSFDFVSWNRNSFKLRLWHEGLQGAIQEVVEDYEDSPWKTRVGAKEGEKTRGIFVRCMGIWCCEICSSHTL